MDGLSIFRWHWLLPEQLEISLSCEFQVSEIMGPSPADYYHMGSVHLFLRYDEMEYIVCEIDEK